MQNECFNVQALLRKIMSVHGLIQVLYKDR